MSKYPDAARVGQLAQRLGEGYYAYAAAMQVAADPRAIELIPSLKAGEGLPSGYVTRRDGSQHIYDFRHYFFQVQNAPEAVQDVARAWLGGSLLALGDALGKPDNKFFDQIPALMLIYHLRNAVAHGNKFNFYWDKSMCKLPAHNIGSPIPIGGANLFEIQDDLKSVDNVLFDYMGPADILDVIFCASYHLGELSLM